MRRFAELNDEFIFYKISKNRILKTAIMIRIIPFLLFVTTLLLFTTCNKEKTFITDGSAKLEFSLDTLRFDTVFTELGSATRFFKVYNPHKESIKISNISVGNGANSMFRLNVDGIPGNEASDVIVFPEDSIYIFGEVTINPDQPISESPFIIHDEIIFETNGNSQTITLEAWGQNANYIPSRWHKDSIFVLPCGAGGQLIWDDPKPYVVYGIVIVEACDLIIPAGAQVHVHGGISKTTDENDELLIYNTGRIFIGPNGSIQVNGTLEDPVVIQGDRLEEDFDDADGQWTGIIIGQTSKGNKFNHAVVKNSLLGIWVDSLAELSLKNTQVYNTSGSGLIGLHASITAENCLFYNNGNRAVQIGYGGNYNFTYCTLASYGVDAPALSLSNGICRDPLCQTADVEPLYANFRNSIIFGSRRDEISLSDFTGENDPFDFNYTFTDCIVRVDELLDPENGFPNFFDFCNPCVDGDSGDALFFSPGDDDYQLDTLSIAEQKASPIPTILFDLIGEMRDSETPDIGCFEYNPN